MFKDIYKSANESIDTDEAFARISKKIHEEKPLNKYKICYKIAAAAACAAIICAVAFNIPFKDNNTADIRVAKSTPANETAKQPYAAEMPKSPETSETTIPDTEAVPTEEKTEKAAVPRVEPRISEKQQQKETQTVENKTEELMEKPAENADIKHEPIPMRIVMKINKIAADHAVMSASTYQYAADTGEAVGESADDSISENDAPEPVLRSAGGGIQTKKAAEPTEISYDEYCEYIGCDIKVKIPSFTDTSAEFSGIYKNADGSIAYDAYTFTFEKGDEYLYVTTTKDLSAVKSYLDSSEYEKSLFGETEAVLTQCDDVYNAYFIKENTAYTLMLGNSSEDELENVISELCR